MRGYWKDRPSTLVRVFCGFVCGAAGFVVACSFLAKSASAVPPIMSPGPHPYDPDWPEVHLIISTKCVACHNKTSEQSDFSSYESLMSVETDSGRVIEPGDVEESLLYQSIVWDAAYDNEHLSSEPEMPPDKLEWLSAGQQETIKRWIERGALQFKLPKTCKPYPLNELDFPSAKQCASCHPRQYEQWSRSMHAYAQQSPVFEAFNLTLVERTSGTIGTFCTRCHTNIGNGAGRERFVAERSSFATGAGRSHVCDLPPPKSLAVQIKRARSYETR